MPTRIKRMINACIYSLAGFMAALRDKGAFQEEILATIVLVPLAFYVPVTPSERLLMLLSLGFVLVVELLNTAIEAAVDHTSLKRHPLAKKAKDCGSAAVMVALAMAILTWVWPFI